MRLSTIYMIDIIKRTYYTFLLGIIIIIVKKNSIFKVKCKTMLGRIVGFIVLFSIPTALKVRYPTTRHIHKHTNMHKHKFKIHGL